MKAYRDLVALRPTNKSVKENEVSTINSNTIMKLSIGKDVVGKTSDGRLKAIQVKYKQYFASRFNIDDLATLKIAY